MDNNLTSGLDVITIDPKIGMTNVSLNKSIRLVFNSELNENTVFGNIFLLEDYNKIYNGDKVISLSQYRQLQVNFSYGDKVVLINPIETLNKNSTYILYIPKNSIKDILGKKMPIDYVSYFITETDVTLQKPEIIFPTMNLVTNKINGIVWKEINLANTYLIEISKFQTFEHLVLQETIVNPIPDIDGNISFNMSSVVLNEGLYYTRVRALNGEFNEPIIFFIKNIDQKPVSVDDSEFIDVSEEIEEDFDVIEFFPLENQSNVSTKLKTIYLKLDKIISPEMAKSINYSLYGEFSDEEDRDDTTKEEHSNIDYKFTIINDYELNNSFIVFTLQ